MALLDIVTGPGMDRLTQCKKQCRPCFFVLCPVGTSHYVRLTGEVLGVWGESGHVWRQVDFLEKYSGLLLSITVNADNPHVGHADAKCAREDIRLRWCGVASPTLRLLAANDVHNVGGLERYSEPALCSMLLMSPSDPQVRQSVGLGVSRYLRMRERLRQIGVLQNTCGTKAKPAEFGQLCRAVEELING